MRCTEEIRSPPFILYLVCCVVLTALVLVPELFGNGKGKDYDLWYWAGQQVLQGKSLYPEDAMGYIPFLYPPLPAILLAIPSALGKAPLYLALSIVNSVSWWVVSRLSNAMTGSARIPGPWLAALPSFAAITFIFEQYTLGQPNLLLLAIILFGFWLLQRNRSISAGAALALAAAIKVFPVAVFPYLLWRRHWWAAISMASFLVVFVVVIPGFVRGFERNNTELKVWARAMTGGEDGFGQRNEQNWSRVNQSLIAVVHRLSRPVDYDPDGPPRYVNIANLDRHTADAVVAVVAALIGLGFILVMPRQSRRTPKSDAEELAILISLVMIASPLFRQYYLVWLFFPLTVLIHRVAYDPRPAVRKGTLTVMVLAALLMSLYLPVFPRIFQALGNNLWATLLLIGCLAWHLRHPPESESDINPLPHPAEPSPGGSTLSVARSE